MLKRINTIINIIIVILITVFIGYGIATYWDYHMHPDLYIMQSAAWYIGIVVHGFITIILLSIAMIVKWLIYRKIK